MSHAHAARPTDALRCFAVLPTAAFIALGVSLAAPCTEHSEPLFDAPFVSFDVGFSPRAVAIGDLNGDRWPDLAVPNAASHTVLVLLKQHEAPTAELALLGAREPDGGA